MWSSGRFLENMCFITNEYISAILNLLDFASMEASERQGSINGWRFSGIVCMGLWKTMGWNTDDGVVDNSWYDCSGLEFTKDYVLLSAHIFVAVHSTDLPHTSCQSAYGKCDWLCLWHCLVGILNQSDVLLPSCPCKESHHPSIWLHCFSQFLKVFLLESCSDCVSLDLRAIATCEKFEN